MTPEKLRQRREQIRDYQYVERVPIDDIEIRETEEHEGIRTALRRPGFSPCTVGRAWGKPWSTAWFRMRFTVPHSFSGLPVVARIDTGGEACAYLKGAPLQGLDRNHNEIRLLEAARGGERFELVIEAGAQGSFGDFGRRPVLSLAEIAAVDDELRGYYWDFDALWEVLHVQPEDSRRRATLLYGMNRSVDTLLVDGFDPGLVRRHVRKARALLKPLLAKPANASELCASLIGHAHIDVAWLWPLRETVRKCSRTFSTVVQYMEQYDHYRFAQSQAHLYWFTKNHYPGLYEKIRMWAKRKRWEVVVGMWVEPDMNIAGAEALVRQILLAKAFTRREFGSETDVLWLPDVFGYCAALPQVLKKAGIDYFSTIKLFWNETNRPPYQSFWWEGIDGTRVLAHFPPNGDYNAVINGERLRCAERQYRQKDRSENLLFPFGWGDGGGGPALEHLERSARYRNLEGLPRTEMRFISDFFHTLEREADDFPVWRGELYLETHRGTYTSQAENKKANRKSEILFREAEFLASLAHALGQDYPHDALGEGWRTILLNQFHDILPGSSIPQVYEESQTDYGQVRAIGEAVRDRGFAALAKAVDTRGKGVPVLVVNSLPWTRTTTVSVELPKSKRGAVEGPEGPVRTWVQDGQVRFQAAVPPMGHAVFHITPAAIEARESAVSASEQGLESGRYRIRFDAQGLIRSIYDKACRREVVAAGGRANQFQRFQDRPTAFDAWNIDEDALATRVPIEGLESVEVLDLGPWRAGVRQVRAFGKSVVRQEIWIEDGCPLIHFDTTVDWREDWQLLKVAFPVDVHADHATFEIQFGHLRRPTHRNTSWDRARFEVCAHKWIDLSEPDYGVALLNDCKFGHDVTDNVLRLTLLKSAKSPDPEADMGTHTFSYALYPHAGDFRAAEVVRRAYEFNVPATAGAVQPGGGALPAAGSFLSMDAPNVMVEALKVEEEGTRWIVRVYETHGQRARATLRCGFDLRKVTSCDLLERNHTAVKARGNAFSFTLKPFEIKTFALLLRR